MLISLPEALEYAEQHHCAVAAVNTPTLEMLTATIEVAERRGVPVILQHAQLHDEEHPIEGIGVAMVELARRSSAPLVVHVDHGETVDFVRRGFEVGFNSAMIDGSKLPYDDNVAITREVVALAAEHGHGVEGELGVMPGREDGQRSADTPQESLYTRPEEAHDFVAQTGVTALACSFGTVHGLYRAEPNIDYDLITALREAAGVPIVMHGGSGLSADEYRRAIERGVRKINYYTYADRAALAAAHDLLDREPDTFTFAPVAAAARAGAHADIAALVECLYGSAGR